MASSSSAVGVRSNSAISMARPSMSTGTNSASHLPEAEASAASRCSLCWLTSTSSTVPTSIWPSLLESTITLDFWAPPCSSLSLVLAQAHRDSAMTMTSSKAMTFFMVFVLLVMFLFIGRLCRINQLFLPPKCSLFRISLRYSTKLAEERSRGKRSSMRISATIRPGLASITRTRVPI